MREADLAVRFSPPRQADLVQRHLMTVSMHIYASAGYIKKHGVPQTTKDLDKHRIVVYGEDVRPPVPDVNWLLRIGYKDSQLRRPTMTVNNVYGVMKAVQSGAGVGALPELDRKRTHLNSSH